MPFVTDYTPISAVLQLGGIAGAGSGMAQQQAKRLQDQQLAAQIAQRNIQTQLEAESRQRQEQAAQQSNQISTALAYDRLNQDQQQFETQQQQQAANTAAQNLLATNRQGEDVRQFNEKNALDAAQQNLAEKKFSTAETEKTSQEKAVNDMIDQLGLPTQETQRLKLQFKATGRLPAPASENDARNLNALTIARKTLVDPYGEALAGKENDLASIDSQIASIVRGVGGQGSPAPIANPRVQVQPTGKTTPEGVPLAHVTVNTAQGPQSAELPAPATPAEAAKLPLGVTFVTPQGEIRTRK